MNPEEEIIEQIPDNMITPSLSDTMMSMSDFAKNIGQTYESIRRKVKKLEEDDNFKDHIATLQNPKTKQTIKYIDKVIQDYILKNRKDKAVLLEDSHKIEQLEFELEETKKDRDRQREEKDIYVKKLQEVQAQLLEYKDNPEKAIDTSKYVLLEDHQKLENRIEELSEEKDSLEKENKALKKDQEQLRDVTLKNIELSRKNDEKMKEIREAEDRIAEAEREKDKANAEKMLVEAEKTKLESEIEAEKIRAEIEKERAAHELEEALKLGFFARRKKLKELKNRQNESKEEE